jgi:hypothetical protein
MAVNPTYPGVYIEEIPSGVHTIIGVATSITAFLGRTASGPVNEAITLTSYADFERAFGGLDPDYPLSYAVADFVANGGSQAVVVRLFNVVGAAAAQAVATAAEESAGDTPAKVAESARTTANDFINNKKPGKDSADTVAKAAETEAAADGATVDSVKTKAKEAADKITDTSTASLGINDNLKFNAAGPGTWGNKLWVQVDTTGITGDVATRYNLDQNLLFNLSVYYNRTNAYRISPCGRMPGRAGSTGS